MRRARYKRASLSKHSALTLPVVFYAGAPFHVAAWKALRHGAANMNSLIALGTGAAFLYSVYSTVRGSHDVYY